MAAYFCLGETTITILTDLRGTEPKVGETSVIDGITTSIDIADTSRPTKRDGKIIETIG